MDIKQFITKQWEVSDKWRDMALKDLTPQELAWRPSSGCNCIGKVLFHMVRMEDSYLHNMAFGIEETWHKGKWYRKLNMAESDTGEYYTVEKVNTFVVPPITDLMAYYAAVRAETLAVLGKMAEKDFDRKVSTPRTAEGTVGSVFGSIIGHTFEHTGEIFYLRGLQRGMDK
jgi:uncharacterized damage-inducible protein DinB